MQKNKILIIDDKNATSLQIKNLLESTGYKVVAIAYNSDSAIESVRSLNIDIIISSIQMKGELNGIEIVELIHKIKNIPTIFLTDFHNEHILKEVSKVNFTGYLVKPYLEEQLLREARLATQCDGQMGGDKSDICKLANGYYFNKAQDKIYLHNKPVLLTKQELALLKILVNNIGNIITKEALEFIIWQDKAVSENSRRQLLFRLKLKLQGLTIETIKGYGYKLHKTPPPQTIISYFSLTCSKINTAMYHIDPPI